MPRVALFAVLIALTACAAKVPPVTDLTTFSSADLTAAVSVRVFTTEQPPPKVERTIAP
jgi:hypothetical protein